MKKNLIIFGTIIIGFMGFLSCNINPDAEQPGSLRISISGKNDGNANSRNLYSWPSDLAGYQANGIGPNGNTFSVSWNVGESCAVDSLAPGNWTISVTGLNTGDIPVLSGTSSVSVVSEQSVTATVYLAYIPGAGSVAFSVNWPEAADVATGTVSLDGNTQALSVEPENQLAYYTFTSITAGTDHEFSLQLYTAIGDMAYGTVGTVHVTNGVETPVELAISGVMNPPTQPENLQIQNGTFCVELTWDDSSGETGFIILRRETGMAAWNTIDDLPADTIAYKDISAESLTDYDYSVVAYNDSGEFQSETRQINTILYSDAIVRKPVSFSDNNGFRVTPDGTVTAYGVNNNCQLALSNTKEFIPEGRIIPGLADIVSVTSSGEQWITVLALDESGDVWRWGAVYIGGPHIYEPVRIDGISRQIVDIAVSGVGSFFALDADGNIWGWGQNEYGQLGNGTTNEKATPTIISGLPEIKSIAGGARHLLALAVNGTIYVSGTSTIGALGLGAVTSQYTVTQVPGISGVRTVRTPSYLNRSISLLIMENGTVMAAGTNDFDMLGLSSDEVDEFTTIPGLSNIVDIHAGSSTTIALDDSGALFGSGWNIDGTLLNLPSSNAVFAKMTGAPDSIVNLFAGSANVICEDSSGNHYIWGNNERGQLMLGYSATNTKPVSVTAPDNFVSIKGGSDHYLALDNAGNVWAWGDNSHGQIGDGTNINRSSPVMVLSETSAAVQIDADGESSMALLADGSIYCWGSRYINGGTTPTLFSDTNLASGVVEIAVGFDHKLARKNDNTVWAWGDNNDGQLGNGTFVDSYDESAPVLNTAGNGPLSGVIKIAAAYRKNAALLNDGTVAVWGDGCLGGENGSTTENVPILAQGITAATDLFAGKPSFFAIQNDALWHWGTIFSDDYPTNINDEYPKLDYLPGIFNIAVNGHSTETAITVLSNGSVFVCGDNTYGVYADGRLTNNRDWNEISELANIIDAANTYTSCAAISSTGLLWAWGYNDLGQAGNGSFDQLKYYEPVPLPW